MRRVGAGLFRLAAGDGEQPVRAVCFPHAGGSASAFHAWPALLKAAADVLALTLPGRGIRIRDELIADLPAIARAVADDLQGGNLLDRPYVLFGHSMGGLVAYATASELARRGLPPATVVGISATPAPWSAQCAAPARQSDDELLDRLRSFQATPESTLTGNAALRALLPAIRADFEACDGYQPAPRPLESPVLCWAGTRDPVAPVETVRAWSEIATTGFELELLDASHFYLDEHGSRIIRGLLAGLITAPAATREFA